MKNSFWTDYKRSNVKAQKPILHQAVMLELAKQLCTQKHQHHISAHLSLDQGCCSFVVIVIIVHIAVSNVAIHHFIVSIIFLEDASLRICKSKEMNWLLLISEKLSVGIGPVKNAHLNLLRCRPQLHPHQLLRPLLLPRQTCSSRKVCVVHMYHTTACKNARLFESKPKRHDKFRGKRTLRADTWAYTVFSNRNQPLPRPVGRPDA